MPSLPPSPASSLSVGECRAKLVLDEIAAHPELVLVVGDIAGLPRFAGWEPVILNDAVDRLVARGSITEAADGRLCVVGWEPTR